MLLRNNHGFSLIELMVTMAIFGILMVVVQALFMNSMDLYYYSQEKSVTRQQLYYIAEEMVRLIRNTPSDQIQLTDSNGDGSNESIELLTSEGVQVVFYLSNQRLYRVRNGDRKQIGEKITQFQITEADGSFQIEIQTQAQGQPNPTWIKTGVTPRF